MKTTTMLLLLCAIGFQSLFAQSSEPQPIAGQYIVTLKSTAAQPVVLKEVTTADRTETQQLNQTTRQTNMNKLSQVRSASSIASANVLAEYADVLVGFTAKLTPEEVARLSANPDVEGVYQDYSMQLDPQALEVQPAEFMEGGQTVPCAIVNAGGFKNSTSANWIWILDTGIDLDHPDLNVNSIFPYGKSFIPGESMDDGQGHGTHVAGIAAAKNNTFGTVGVSAGAAVVPVKVLNNGGKTSMTYVLQGLNHVAQYDKINDVVNMSLGAYPVSNCENNFPALKTAVQNLGNSGTWVCIASGNESGRAAFSSPGCINGNRVFTVGGTTCAGGCFTPSNWGATVVDWVATGSNVYSTFKNGGYATLSGTSMATPVVAGIIHARGGAPVSSSTVTCGNSSVPPAVYKIARRN